MKNKILLFASAIAVLTSSCSEDFLTAEPIMSQSPETYYKNDEQMFSALVAAYDPLNYCSINPLGYFVPYAEITSDNANTGLGGDNEKAELRDMEMYRTTTVNEISEQTWKFNYMGVSRCNAVINAEFTSDKTKVYKAEAHFLRAWYMFQLQRNFGPCVISLETDYPLEYPFERSTREQVNAQIEKDLEIAINGCDEKPEMTGRINKSAARALLAKHYLYAADWDNDNAATFKKAIPLFESVINSGQYNLLPYTKLFNYKYRNNKECIFEIQTTTLAAGQNKTDTPWTLDAGMWAKWCGTRTLKNHPLFHGEMMWGGMFLTKDLYDYYIDGDETRRDETFITEAQMVLKGQKGKDGKNPVKWNKAGANIMDWEGFDQRKFTVYWDTPFSGAMGHNKMFANVQVIRLSDVYLMLAEAYLRGENNINKAKELINAVRAAHEPNAKYLTVDDMMTAFPDRFPKVIDVLWYERRVELAGEGDRRYDLVRSGRCKDVMTKFLSTGRLRNRVNITWNNTMNYMPIDIEETEACPTLTSYPDEAFK